AGPDRLRRGRRRHDPDGVRLPPRRAGGKRGLGARPARADRRRGALLAGRVRGRGRIRRTDPPLLRGPRPGAAPGGGGRALPAGARGPRPPRPLGPPRRPQRREGRPPPAEPPPHSAPLRGPGEPPGGPPGGPPARPRSAPASCSSTAAPRG